MKRFSFTSWSFGLICGLIIAFALTITLMSPKVVEVERVVNHYIDVPIETKIEVIKGVPVEKIVYQDEIVEIPVEVIKWGIYNRPSREFVSLEELQMWISQNSVKTLRFVADHVAKCDDFAYFLQRTALTQGYLMSTQVNYTQDGQHMINSTIIGNILYYIEPETDQVWFYWDLVLNRKYTR